MFTLELYWKSHNMMMLLLLLKVEKKWDNIIGLPNPNRWDVFVVKVSTGCDSYTAAIERKELPHTFITSQHLYLTETKAREITNSTRGSGTWAAQYLSFIQNVSKIILSCLFWYWLVDTVLAVECNTTVTKHDNTFQKIRQFIWN